MRRMLGACLLITALFVGCTGRDQSEKAPTGKRNHPLPMAQESDSSSASGAKLGSAGGPVELDSITLVAPAGWDRREASSGFVLAEFYLPKAEGDERDGRLTVSTAGGDVEANIERWRSQFGGKPKAESRRTIQANGLEITLVDFSGDFQDQRGPFAPATLQLRSRLLGAVIPVEGELYFVKVVGPEKTISAHEEEFVKFVESAKKR